MAHGDTGQGLPTKHVPNPSVSCNFTVMAANAAATAFCAETWDRQWQFYNSGDLETRPDKAVAISVKSHPELARKTGPSLAEELQASFGLGGQLPPPWPWLQGLPPGLSLPRAFGGSTPHVPHRAPHCGNISSFAPLGKNKRSKEKKKKS